MANVYLYDLADTWTTGGTAYDAIKMDVADNASATGSDLLDLQVGSSSKFRIRKDGVPFSSAATYAQAAKTTSGTIDIVSTGVYVPTGLTFVLSLVGNGMTLGTTDKGALKNTSGITRTFRVAASYDGHAGNNQQLGIKLAKNGTVIDESECRAFAASSNAIAKLFCFWFVELADDDEISIYAANHTATDDITFQRGRIQAEAIITEP
jgi:hypothetical protein